MGQNSRRSVWLEPILVLLVAFLFSLWSSGWLLKEDFWGIDDATYFRITMAADAALKADGLGAWYRTLMPPEENNFGPTTALYSYFTYKLFGVESVAGYHFLKLLQRALFICLLWGTVRVLGGGFVGAVVAVLLGYFFNAMAVLPDMQSYSANWWRLYTTDSHGAMPLVGFWFFSAVLFTLYTRRKLTGLIAGSLIAMALFCLLAGVMAKLNYVYYLPTLITLAVLCVTAGAYPASRKAQLVGGGFLLAGMLVILSAFPVFNIGVGGVEVRRYEGQSLGDPRAILNAAQHYFLHIIEFAGPLFVIPFFAGVWSLVWIHWKRNALPWAVRFRRVFVLGILAGAIGGFLLQCVWPIILPRYMISYIPLLAIGCGFFCGRFYTRVKHWYAHPLVYTSIALAVTLTLLTLWLAYYPLPRRFPAATLLLAVLLTAAAVAVRMKGYRFLGNSWFYGAFLSALVFQCIVAVCGYLEARTFFKVQYQGENLTKHQLREVTRSGEEFALYSTYEYGEFLSNTVWFLNELEGRRVNVYPTMEPVAATNGPRAVHNLRYPHPGSGPLFDPWFEGEYSYSEVGGTNPGDEHFAGALIPTELGEELSLATVRFNRRFYLGKISLRLETWSLNYRDRVSIQIVDVETGRIVTTAEIRGSEMPRARTNTLPILLDNKVWIEADRDYEVRAVAEDSSFPSSFGSILFAGRDTRLPVFLRFRQPDESVHVGLVFFEAATTLPADSGLFRVYPSTVSAPALALQPPYGALRRKILTSFNPAGVPAARIIDYKITSTLAVRE